MTARFTHGYALLIGVNKNQAPGLALPTVARDIKALHHVLVHPERCAYPDDHVQVVTGKDATRTQILAGVDWLRGCIERASGDVTAVVYFSGHGWRDADADPPVHYLIPYDLDRQRLRPSALRADVFAQAVHALRPRRLLVVLDCCHAGGMDVKDMSAARYVASPVPPATLALQQGHGRAVLSSSQGEQKSYIRSDGKMSHFTYHLIEALTGHAQPQGGASEVLVSDVLGHVHRRVPVSVRQTRGAEQHPDYLVTGNFPIALLLGGTGVTVDRPPPSPLASHGYKCGAAPPETLVSRAELDALLDALCQEPRSAAMVALCGGGGFGKTTLAQAACQSPRVQHAYPDGVLWATLGEHVSPGRLTRHVLDLIRQWSDRDPPSFTDAGAAGAELREQLSGKRVLVVIDDAWAARDVAPFIGAGAAVLVTTRDRRVVRADCHVIAVDAMAVDESVALLKSGLDDAIADAPDGVEDALAALARRLNYWPLLLKLVNGQLRARAVHGGQALRAALDRVERKLDKKGLTAFDIKDDHARSTAVQRTVEVSLASLDDDSQRRYLALAVFPEDIDVPTAALEKLWQVDEFDVEDQCVRLHELSLLQRFDMAEATVRLHDVFRRYLIDRQGDALPALHQRWLDALRPPTGRWSELADREHYAWTHVIYHLREAGHDAIAADLLADYAWIDGKLRATDAAALLADYGHVSGDRELDQIRDTLRLSSHVLAADVTHLPGQILGRLDPSRDSGHRVGELVQQARGEARYPWLRPRVATLTPPGGPLVRTLTGHAHFVSHVAVSADGARAVSASADATLKVWDLRAGVELRTLIGHADSVSAVAITPDGARAVSASWDKTVKLWDLHTGVELLTLSGHPRPVQAVVLTPDGARVIAATINHDSKVWDLTSGAELLTLSGYARSANGLAVTPDGTRVVCNSDRRTVKVWDLRTGAELHTLPGHKLGVTAIAVTSDSARATIASRGGVVTVWDLQTGAKLRVYNRLQGNAVAFTRDGARALIERRERLGVYDLEAGVELLSLLGHHAQVEAVAVTPDENVAVSASRDHTLKVWDLRAEPPPRRCHNHTDSVSAVAVTPDGARAVSGSFDGTARVWDLHTGAERHILRDGRVPVTAVAVSSDSARVVLGPGVEVLDLADGVSPHRAPIDFVAPGVTAFAMMPDGAHLLYALSDHTLRVRHLRSPGVPKLTLSGHSDRIRAVVVTADGSRAVSASEDRTLKVWDLDTGVERHTLSGHGCSVTAVAVTPDGRRVISGSWSGMLAMWDLHTGAIVRALSGHTLAVAGVVVTSDGACAISVSQDQTCKLWDLNTGAILASFVGESSMTACAADRHGDMLVIGDYLGCLYILDVVRPRVVDKHEIERGTMER